MSKALTHPIDRAGASAPKFDMYLMLPFLAVAYVEIISPLLLAIDMGPRTGSMWTAVQRQIQLEPRIENKIFWPVMGLLSVCVVIRNWARLTFPPHIIWLFGHLM